MKLIQSLDTSLIRDINLGNSMLDKINSYNLILRMTILSHLRLLQYYPEKEVELYVDDYTYDLIKDIFPKSLRKLTDITPLNKTHIWTQSKLALIGSMKEPFLHIDCDIIFKQKINLNAGLYTDVFVERKEDKYTFNWYQNGIFYIDEMYQLYKKLEFVNHNSIEKYWQTDLNYAYNCGIIGFKDFKIKDRYVELYNQLENLYTYGLSLKPYYEQIFVVLEQYSLNCFIQKEEISVTTLLPSDNLTNQGEFANRIGYVHLFGVGKYMDFNVLKIKNILESEYPSIYKEILRIEKNIVL